MPSSSVRAFREPDEYAAAIRQVTHSLTITQRGIFAAKLFRIDLHRLWMQHFSENLSRTSYMDDWGGRAVIAFRTQPGSRMVRNGVELDPTTISRLRPGQSYYQHLNGATSYGSISLPLEDMTSLGAAIVGRDLVPTKDTATITPSPSAMTRLQHLHGATRRLAEDSPAVLAHPEAVRGLEQALIEAMMDCLGGEVREDRVALRQHAVIMRRFHSVIEQHLDQPLYIPELCVEIGASQRSLRACCQEYLGMSPKRYLLLRRMQLVRRALRESAPTGTTVAEIATRYGFWEFGRFAGEYKLLFGELPSATLAHSP